VMRCGSPPKYPIAAHPVEPEDLIGQPQIGGAPFGEQGGVGQIAEGAESELEGHDNDLPLLRKAIALEGDVPDVSGDVHAAAVCRAGHVTAAVQEDHNRYSRLPVRRFPNVDCEAVFFAVQRARHRNLRAARRLLCGVVHVAPFRARLCFAPPQGTFGGSRVRDSEKGFNTVFGHPPHPTGLRLDDRRLVLRSSSPARTRGAAASKTASKDNGNTPWQDQFFPHA